MLDYYMHADHVQQWSGRNPPPIFTYKNEGSPRMSNNENHKTGNQFDSDKRDFARPAPSNGGQVNVGPRLQPNERVTDAPGGRAGDPRNDAPAPPRDRR
jgi:hypothetical protein